VGGGHQLSTGDAPPFVSSDQQGLEVGARGVDGRCVTSGTRSNNDEVFDVLGGLPGRRHRLMRSDYELSLRSAPALLKQ
jgi:hypothetical protein